MKRPDLIQAYKSSLLDAQRAFTADEEDYARHIIVALDEVNRLRPRHVLGTLMINAGAVEYPCPDDLITVFATHYGRNEKTYRNPWDANYPSVFLPSVFVAFDAMGHRVLRLNRTPSAHLISVLGSVCEYEYTAAHIVTAEVSTLTAIDAGLVMLRAQAEAMRELAMRNSSQPTQLRDGLTNSPANGTPSHLYTLLMSEFNERVRLTC